MNMLRLMRLIPWGRIALLALLCLPYGGAQAAGQTACGCTEQDKIDLENRIKRVEAAIKEYDSLVPEWERKEKGSGEALLLTPTFRNSVQDSVRFKMRNVKDPNAVDYAADTDPSCKVTIDPAASLCLRGALEDHEGLHKKECEKNKDKHLIDWRFTQRVVDYMKEEKAGYQKELERLTQELDKLKKTCAKVTQLDKSGQHLKQDLLAQRARLNQAETRVEKYAKTLR